MLHLKSLLFLAILLSCFTLQSQDNTLYFGQTPPALKPKVFAPGLISMEEEYEFGSVFNAKGTEFYYGVDAGGKSEIRYSQLKDGVWSDPVPILINDRYGFNDPFLSPDESKLYWISQRPDDGVGEQKDYDIWYVEKEKGGWSEPINAGPNINSSSNEYYISFTQEGTMYFASNRAASDFDIYYSKSVEGEFQEAVRLGDAINTPHYEADVFIDPAEKYIIFCANRPDGLGRGDLYISFKKDDGSWTPSKNMGAPINTKGHELCPFVTQDGKYLLYTSNKDIYWVSTEILERYR